MGKLKDLTLFEILKENLSRATVFEFFSIDYPNHLYKNLWEIADMHGLDPDIIEDALSSVHRTMPEFDYDFLELPVLVAYLKHTHHEYTKAKIPHIRKNLERLQLNELLSAFNRFSRDIQKHIMLEEKVIFPFILNLIRLNEEFDLYEAQSLLGQYSTDVLAASHTKDDDEMKELRELTGSYQFDDKEPILYQVVMTDLARLEEDIFRHSRIEDGILFVKAKKEERLLTERISQIQRNN